MCSQPRRVLAATDNRRCFHGADMGSPTKMDNPPICWRELLVNLGFHVHLETSRQFVERPAVGCMIYGYWNGAIHYRVRPRHCVAISHLLGLPVLLLACSSGIESTSRTFVQDLLHQLVWWRSQANLLNSTDKEKEKQDFC